MNLLLILFVTFEFLVLVISYIIATLDVLEYNYTDYMDDNPFEAILARGLAKFILFHKYVFTLKVVSNVRKLLKKELNR